MSLMKFESLWLGKLRFKAQMFVVKWISEWLMNLAILKIYFVRIITKI